MRNGHILVAIVPRSVLGVNRAPMYCGFNLSAHFTFVVASSFLGKCGH